MKVLAKVGLVRKLVLVRNLPKHKAPQDCALRPEQHEVLRS